MPQTPRGGAWEGDTRGRAKGRWWWGADVACRRASPTAHSTLSEPALCRARARVRVLAAAHRVKPALPRRLLPLLKTQQLLQLAAERSGLKRGRVVAAGGPAASVRQCAHPTVCSSGSVLIGRCGAGPTRERGAAERNERPRFAGSLVRGGAERTEAARPDAASRISDQNAAGHSAARAHGRTRPRRR